MKKNMTMDMHMEKCNKYTTKECLNIPFIVKEFDGVKYYAFKPVWKEEHEKIKILLDAGLVRPIANNSWYVLTDAGVHSRYILLFKR